MSDDNLKEREKEQRKHTHRNTLPIPDIVADGSTGKKVAKNEPSQYGAEHQLNSGLASSFALCPAISPWSGLIEAKLLVGEALLDGVVVGCQCGIGMSRLGFYSRVWMSKKNTTKNKKLRIEITPNMYISVMTIDKGE